MGAPLNTLTTETYLLTNTDDALGGPTGLVADGTYNDYRTLLSASGGNDTLTGFTGPENWPVFAASGAPEFALNVYTWMSGEDGNDRLIQSLGYFDLPPALAAIYTHMDEMVGGLGNDTFVLSRGGYKVTELAGEGTNSVVLGNSFFISSGNDTFDMNTDAQNVENARMLQNAFGTISANISGNHLNNVIIGNDFTNSLFGNDGNDSLYGGLGLDLLDGGNGNDRIFGGLGLDDLTGRDGNDLMFGGDGVDGVDGGLGNDFLDGGAGNDNLYGGLGNDTLDGGSGAEWMLGGEGNDLYVLDSANDLIADVSGFDTARSATVDIGASQSLGGIEVLQLTGQADLNIRGLSTTTTLLGNAGKNILTGDTGNDTISGGAGNDTLRGGTGNDVLDGGTGADALEGGIGNDVYTLDSMDDTVTDSGGTDTVQSSTIDLQGSNFSGVEVLRLTGNLALDITSNGTATTLLGNAGQNILSGATGDDSIFASAGDDTLYGGAGNDLLGGGTGNDSLVGGEGSDTYIMDAADDIVSESGTGAGEIDTVRSSTLSLSATDYTNIETLELAGLLDLNLTGGGSVASMFGNDGANLITAGAGAELVDAGAGNDTLAGFNGNGEDAIVDNDTVYGGSGDDTYLVADASDALVIFEAFGSLNGRDTVQLGYGTALATDFANFEVMQLTGSDNFNLAGGGTIVELIGNAGSNQLFGVGAINEVLSGGDGRDDLYGGIGDGSDTMIGGAGNDGMFGRDGADFFVFGDADVGDGSSTDSIYDFEHTIDKIDLSSTLVAFATDNGIYQAGQGPQITYSKGSGSLFYAVNMDLDGDGDTDLSVQVFTSLLDSNDFIFSDSIIS